MEIRNHCNMVCRYTKRRHIHNSVENNDPAQVWAFLRTLGVGKSRHDTIPNDLTIELDKTTKLNTLTDLSQILTPDHPPFVFGQLSACDVKKSILANSSNAVGSDYISRNINKKKYDLAYP